MRKGESQAIGEPLRITYYALRFNLLLRIPHLLQVLDNGEYRVRRGL